MTSPLDSSLPQYARFLANCLEKQLAVPIPKNFESRFRWHVGKLGNIDYQDLGSLLLLECQQLKADRKSIDEAEVLRVLDRIRHRLVRQERRTVSADYLNRLPQSCTPTERDQLRVVIEFLATLTAQESFLFESCFLDGRSVATIGSETGISQATIYRQLAELKGKFEKYIGTSP